MSTVKLTMHNLLAMLKRYDDRINNAIAGPFAAVYNHSNPSSEEDVEKSKSILVSKYMSAVHLIENYHALEAARIQSNANTKVTIGEFEYTVADAIKRKQMIGYEKKLLNQMKKSYNDATAAVARINGMVQKEADEVYRTTLGQGQNPSSDILDLAQKASDNYVEAHKAEIIDPNDLAAKIEALEKSIEDFETNVDSALSVSNALTTVEVELND